MSFHENALYCFCLFFLLKSEILNCLLAIIIYLILWSIDDKSLILMKILIKAINVLRKVLKKELQGTILLFNEGINAH